MNSYSYDDPSNAPPPFKVKKAKDSAFNIDTCMDDFKGPEAAFEPGSDPYFTTYSHFGIHEDMLKDRTRTLAYRSAITRNPHLFKDKIVLDIGCGTSILSIFAAKAGAKHVYGIENANIAKHAKNIVQENGFEDKITIIKGKVEEVELPVDKVDIIISEWMGYFLLFESMLDTVVFARDKWLKPDGIMMPDRAIIYLAAVEDEKYRSQIVDFWDNVYDVKMGSIKKWVLFEPLVDIVRRTQVNTNNCPILDLDLQTVRVKDLEFSSKYRLRVNRDDKIQGLVAWFDVYFSFGYENIRLSTSPFLKDTHWKQTIFYFNDSLVVKRDDMLYGSIAVWKSAENKRDLDIKLSYHLKNNSHNLSKVQCYRLC